MVIEWGYERDMASLCVKWTSTYWNIIELIPEDLSAGYPSLTSRNQLDDVPHGFDFDFQVSENLKNLTVSPCS